ncbi:hypothetical protein FGIG_10972 [Fasciola gigantica]|uniref:Uncharacterized protein n=1 Tax=Fasciola gigantica TaxID=46835 RepID=A0A504YT94_FASGI|nr:hypothetical protein FGIG_10972 [Fasciola gigantica]
MQPNSLQSEPKSPVFSTSEGLLTVRLHKVELKPSSVVDAVMPKAPRASSFDSLQMRYTESVKALANNWPHLPGIPLTEAMKARVDMLMCSDVHKAHLVLDQRLRKSKEPLAVASWLDGYYADHLQQILRRFY